MMAAAALAVALTYGARVYRQLERIARATESGQ